MLSYKRRRNCKEKLWEQFEAQLQEKGKQHVELTLEKDKIEAQRREQQRGAEIQAQEGKTIKARVQEKEEQLSEAKEQNARIQAIQAIQAREHQEITQLKRQLAEKVTLEKEMDQVASEAATTMRGRESQSLTRSDRMRRLRSGKEKERKRKRGVRRQNGRHHHDRHHHHQQSEQGAVVMHAAPLHYKPGTMRKWIEEDNKGGRNYGNPIVDTRTSRGKVASSEVIYMKSAMEVAKLRMGRKLFHTTKYEWGRVSTKGGRL